MSPSGSVADLATVPGNGGQERQECALEEIAQMTFDALKYENFGAAVSALRSLKRTATVHSVYRELLLLYARIHGTTWSQLSKYSLPRV